MKLAAAVLIIILVGCKHAAPQTDNHDAAFAHIRAGIEHYKKDSEITEYVLRNSEEPGIKNCRAKGWPNTEECQRMSLAMIRTLQLYFDNKLPGVERPPFNPGGQR